MTTKSNEWMSHSPPVDEQHAFTAAYDRHATAVYRYAFSLLRNPETAQDLLQETFLTLWRRRNDINLTESSLIGWLLVTCRNLAANHRRHSAQRISLASLDDPNDHSVIESAQHSVESLDPSNQFERKAELEWVLAAIENLGPVDRRLVELCLLNGFSYIEAAQQTGITVDGTTKRISRTRSRLRALRSSRQKDC